MAAAEEVTPAERDCPDTLLPGQSDYFFRADGTIRDAYWRRSKAVLALLDAAADARIAASLSRARMASGRIAPQNVLLTSVEVPGREADLARAIARIATNTRHNLDVAVTRMRPAGKFDNINAALLGHDLEKYDWLLIIDDDISVPDNFLDILLYFSGVHDLKLAQPAHRLMSYKSYKITERHWGVQARRTGFIEIGPVSLLHRETFIELVPFPSSRWCWGLDVLWAHIARQRGWRMGVVDAVPIRHLRPVGSSYNTAAARDEAIAFLNEKGVAIGRREIFSINEPLIS